MNRLKLNTLSKDELIDYIQELDGIIYELQSENNKAKIDLDKSKLLLKDILDSAKDFKSKHELENRLNFEDNEFNIELNNLIEYIIKYCKEYKLFL